MSWGCGTARFIRELGAPALNSRRTQPVLPLLGPCSALQGISAAIAAQLEECAESIGFASSNGKRLPRCILESERW
jgi:hypothetical protein